MSKADIWMPFYVADYLADTMHLTTAEHGAYLLLILHYWKSGPLADDDARLATISRLGDAWSNASSTIKAFFEQRDGMLYHKRIDHEKASAASNKDRNHARAQAAAAKRWKKDAPSNAPSNASAMLVDCPSPSPSPSPSIKAKSKPAPDKPARFDPIAMPLPECLHPADWAAWVSYRKARKLTLTEPTMLKQLQFLSECNARGQPPDAIINTSITNGWQGLFELKAGGGSGKHSINRSDRTAATIAELTGANRHAAPAIDGVATRVG